jgi:hypothetical protein
VLLSVSDDAKVLGKRVSRTRRRGLQRTCEVATAILFAWNGLKLTCDRGLQGQVRQASSLDESLAHTA